MLELRNITYEVEDNQDNKEILKDVSLTIDEHFVAITGPNGGGKSTLAKIIAGIIKPTSGQIILDGEDITELDITERAKHGISYAFQQPVRFKGIKVRDLITRTGDLLKEGIAIAPNDYQTQIKYSFTSLNKIKPEMIEEATKNAREAAEKFAKDSESRLGKIQSASQGLFTINDRDKNTPFIKEVRVVTMVNYQLDN